MIRVRLAEALAKRRLSIVELSDRTGIGVRDLEILRDGRALAVRLSTLDALCRALGCAPGDLLDYDGD
ncbi:MAG TPA: helix-turn-helix domain-containing protein [Asticcacaulis sp.]|jgi:putative transcriptional regulator